jgi:hypothetical protein
MALNTLLRKELEQNEILQILINKFTNNRQHQKYYKIETTHKAFKGSLPMKIRASPLL